MQDFKLALPELDHESIGCGVCGLYMMELSVDSWLLVQHAESPEASASEYFLLVKSIESSIYTPLKIVCFMTVHASAA